jgi:Zn finger protein HypA/HybF involved in hydrogenase expression
LLELKIKPQKLTEYVSSEIAYKTKISNLNVEAQEWKSRVETLRSFNNALLKQNTSLNAADRILRNKQIPIKCRKCNSIFPFKIKTREEYQSMIMNGLVTNYHCPICHFPNQSSPHDELAEIALSILPKKEEI